MSELDLVKKFWNLFSEQRWDEAKLLLDENVIVEWPQSRERMRGPAKFIDVNRYYPGNHKIEVIHAYKAEDKVVTTVWIVADTGQKTFANSYFEIRNEKISRIEEYWAEPYQAPEWRSKWVEIY